MKPIEAIEELFIGAWGHTITLEYMEGENNILITIESTEGIISQGECDWGADENLGKVLTRLLERAMRL